MFSPGKITCGTKLHSLSPWFDCENPTIIIKGVKNRALIKRIPSTFMKLSLIKDMLESSKSTGKIFFLLLYITFYKFVNKTKQKNTLYIKMLIYFINDIFIMQHNIIKHQKEKITKY